MDAVVRWRTNRADHEDGDGDGSLPVSSSYASRWDADLGEAGRNKLARSGSEETPSGMFMMYVYGFALLSMVCFVNLFFCI